jgi:predicted ester cyclase
MSITETNKKLYRRFMAEVVSNGDMRVADEILAPDVREYERLPPGYPPTAEGIKRLFTTLRGAFPDLEATIEDQVAEHDKVVARVTLQGTHKGDFLGIAPTHRRVAYEAIDISRFVDGRLVEHWGIPDYLTLLQQLGVTRLPPPA